MTAWSVAPRTALNMGILDHSEDEEEEKQCTSGRGSSFLARRLKRRPGSQQLLLLMDCVGNGGGGGASEEEAVPLPEYERLPQPSRLPDDPDPTSPAAAVEEQKPLAKQSASPPQPQQKPVAWRLIEYVRSRHRAGGAAGGCGSSDGDSKSSDGEKEAESDGGEDGHREGKRKEKKKKRSSWLPDPDRRWPVQGFY